jgi:hypothetical protein
VITTELWAKNEPGFKLGLWWMNHPKIGWVSRSEREINWGFLTNLSFVGAVESYHGQICSSQSVRFVADFFIAPMNMRNFKDPTESHEVFIPANLRATRVQIKS